MRVIVLILLIGLAGCGADPLPPLRLTDANARCGHLRQSDPALFTECVRGVEFGNELRIESRQRYLRQQSEDWQPAPMYVAPPTYVPAAATLMAPPTPPPGSMAPSIGLDPYNYLRPQPATVLCVGQIAIPGGSNEAGMRAGCQ
jgi:hypothetical protein